MEEYLGQDERLVYASRQHPIILFKPLSTWIAAVAFLSVFNIIVSARTDNEIATQVVTALVAAVTLYAVSRALAWWFARYVLTDRRVMLIKGLLSVHIFAIPLSKINDTVFSRSIPGRIFGYGDLVLESAGERAGMSHLRFLPKPKHVYRLLTSLLSEHDRPAPFSAPSPRWPGARSTEADDTGPLPRVI